MAELFQVGWAGRFPDKATRLTPFDFEARRWRELGYPVWPVFTRCEPHASDCAVNNEPALPAGPCDCGASNAGVLGMDHEVKRPETLPSSQEGGEDMGK